MKSKFLKYSILTIMLLILLGGITSCSNLFNMNPFGSVTFAFTLPSHLRSARATNYSLKVYLYDKDNVLMQSQEKTIEEQTTVINFSTIPINKYIYASAEVYISDVLVYSGKSKIIRTKKGDNKLEIGLDKFYTVNFSVNGTSKLISVKYGELIPISEIPEVPADDGKVVLWFLDNTPFNFSNGITKDIELSASVVNVDASNVVDVLKTRYGDEVHDIKVVGEINSDTIFEIAETLCSFSNDSAYCPLFNIDLSATTGITEIPGETFRDCFSLASINLPNTVTKIGYGAFFNCINLKTINLGNNLSILENSVFSYCNSLKEITLPASLTQLGQECFSVCSNLSKITVASGNAVLSAEGTALYNKDKTKLIAWSSATGDITNLPNSLNTIGASAFSVSSITSIKIPDTVTTIEDGAFWNCQNLTSVELGKNLSTIGYFAFRGCQRLKEITIPASVTEIGDGAFTENFSLSKITVEQGNQYYVSEGTKLYTKDKTKLLAWTNASGSITIPSGVKIIGRSVFTNNDKITSVIIPDSVVHIDMEAFAGCRNLAFLILGNNVSKIDEFAFGNCEKLRTVTIPISVTYIGRSAFRDCSSLRTVSYAGTKGLWDQILIGDENNDLCNARISYGTIQEIPTNEALVSAREAVEQIRTLTGRNKVVVTGYCDSSTIAAIGQAIKNNSTATILLDLSSVEGLTEIPQQAFCECTNLVSVSLPDSVTIVGGNAFCYCRSLTSVNLGKNVSTLDWGVFASCESLTEITIPASVTEIGESIFSRCSNLTGLTVESGNNYFVAENGALYDKNNTRLIAWPTASGDITLPETLITIEREAFSNCENLTSVVIGKNVSTIKAQAFSWCGNLSKITIPASVEKIEWGAFDGCENLKNVTYTGTEEMWQKISFGDNNDYLRNANITYTREFQDIPTNEVTVTASDAANKISTLSGRNRVIVTGECSFDTLSIIKDALSNNENVSVILDLSETGLTSIPDYAFPECQNLVGITIPASVTEIGEGCFAGCSSLTNITVANENQSFVVEDGALYDMAKTRLIAWPTATGKIKDLPSSLEKIDAYAFYDTSIVSIEIPNSVTSIGNSAFRWCYNLTEITIPASVTYIGEECFARCSSLTNITVANGNQSFVVEDGALYNKEKTRLIVWPSASGNITLSDELIIIESCAFSNCENLTSVVIGKNVSTIEREAFSNCNNLSEITIPESVTKIGNSAFSNCGNLKKIVIPSSISEIPESAFSWCSSLAEITIPVTVEKIEWGAFAGCEKLQTVNYAGAELLWNEIIIGDNNDSLQYASRNYGNATEIPINDIEVNAYETASKISTLNGRNRVVVTGSCSSDTVSEIGQALRNTNAKILLDLSEVKELTEIPEWAFADCDNLVSISLPNTVTVVNRYAFKQCRNLTSVNLGNSVSTLERDVFGYCENLKEFTIPATLTYIGSGAFDGCEKLQTVNYAGTEILWNQISNEGNNGCLYNASNINYGNISEIPTETEQVKASEAASTISTLSGRTRLVVTGVCSPETVSEIGQAISNNSDASILLDLSQTSELTEIPEWAFEDCDSLVSIVLPNTVTIVRGSAFNNCRSLTSVNLGNSVSELEWRVFNWCEKLKEITIPTTLTTIGDGCFAGCSNLTNITVADGNQNFVAENGTLYDLNKTKLIAWPAASGEITELPSNLEIIGVSAFEGSSITSVSVPNFVTIIENSAFSGCYNLTSVHIGENLSTIQSYAFGWCNNLTEISIPSSVTEIGEGVFSGCSNLTNITVADGNQNFVAENGALYDLNKTKLIAWPAASGEITNLPDTLEIIQEDAFNCCRNLTRITIPKTVTKFGRRAFGDCNSLISVTFGNKEGWYCTESWEYTNGEPIDVSDSSTNAINLKDEAWGNYYLYRVEQ